MADKETAKKLLPPYVPYRTFTNFLDSLKRGIPQRIDRSLMGSTSGSLQRQIMQALEYLNLITDTGTPTEKLEQLVHSEGPKRQGFLREILESSYDFMFKDGIQLDRATASQFRERFEKTGATGDTLRKCMAFFLTSAKAAEISLSPHIKKVPGLRPGSAKPRRKEPQIPKDRSDLIEEPQSPHEIKLHGQAAGDSWENILRSKFPAFDPAWPDEVKSKWFDDFKALMELKK